MQGKFSKCARGRYVVQNRSKYLGDVSNVIYRSGLELKLLRYLDLHPDVLHFASEEVVIPYISPIDGRVHRYFVDFYVEFVRPDKTVERLLIEVKPSTQTAEPKRPKKLTPRFLEEAATWAVNQAKWDAATKFCESKGMKFRILTEKEIR